MMGVGESTGFTGAGDVPPVMAGLGSMATKPRPTKTDDKPKKPSIRSRVVSGIIGRIKEDEDGVIPNDAREVDSLVTSVSAVAAETPNLPNQDKPTSIHNASEPLISPAAALVAPDVTPDALKPLDPSQVPGADLGSAPKPRQEPPPVQPRPSPTEPSSALDMILGKTAPANISAPTPSGPALQAGGSMPVESMLPGIISPASASSGVPLSEASLLASQGAGMPEHKSTGGEAILSAFRRFSR